MSQLKQRLVERRSFERKVARLETVDTARCDRFSRLHTQRFFACAHPEREVCQPRRPLKPDPREIAESLHRRVEQCPQDARLSLGELAPVARFIPPKLGRQRQELYDECTVEKFRPCRTELGDRVEDQRTGSIEDGLVVVAGELAPAEPPSVASRQAASVRSSGRRLKLSKHASQEFLAAAVRARTVRGTPLSAEAGQ